MKKDKSIVDLKHQTWSCFSGISQSSDEILKTHFVHKSLITNLNVDLMERSFLLSDIKKAESVTVDESGPIFQDRPYEVVRLDTLKITIPSEDVVSMFDVITTLPKRKFKDGTEYFKLKTWNVCIVLSVSQKEFLEENIELLLERASERAEDFYDNKVNIKPQKSSNN